MKELKENLGDLFLSLIKSVYIILSCGFLLYKAYYWFILPVFTNLPTISFSQAIGLTLFITVSRLSVKSELKEEYYKDEKNIRTWMALLAPWIFLGLAWVVKLFIL